MTYKRESIYHIDDPIKIEHHCSTKDIRWNDISGNYFAPSGEGDCGFGEYKHEYYIKPGTKIFKSMSSVDFLENRGFFTKYNARLKRKYNHFAESWNNNPRNTSGEIAKIESYHDLYTWSDITNDPNVCYLESQLAAIRVIKREFNPQIVHFTSEDDLNPNQYIVLDKECLDKVSTSTVRWEGMKLVTTELNENRFNNLKTFEEYISTK